eukprot:gene28656-9133_t
MTNVISSQPELMRKEGKNQSSIGSPLVERASRAASTTSTSANGVAIKTASEDNSNATLFFFLRALNRYEPGLVHLVLVHLAGLRTQIENEAMP